VRIIIDVPEEDNDALVQACHLHLEGVIATNMAIMRRKRIPPLYSKEAGIVYRLEPPGLEEFANCLQVLGLAPRPSGLPGRWADCDDVLAYRCAELRLHGENATPRIVWAKYERPRKHAQIRRGDGSIEDGCLILLRNEENKCWE